MTALQNGDEISRSNVLVVMQLIHRGSPYDLPASVKPTDGACRVGQFG